jgi:hypothetical protein
MLRQAHPQQGSRAEGLSGMPGSYLFSFDMFLQLPPDFDADESAVTT